MRKVFVIPDVHLKTWMFKRATELIQKGDYSPIWVRPQEGAFRLYPWDMMQVVGHTPVEAAQLDGKLFTLDTFSTFRNGQPIGDERFYWIDTETEEYHIVE